MITGPRQVGKSTLIEELGRKGQLQYEKVTLDDPHERYLAKTDPQLFLESHKVPLFIDEFQYATELLPYIKMAVDKRTMTNNLDASGLFILTSSQMFKMMSDVSESLAGRVGILNLFSLSSNEIYGNKEDCFLPAFANLKKRENNTRLGLAELYNSFISGSMPRMHLGLNINPSIFYSEYTQTYLEKDIKSF